MKKNICLFCCALLFIGSRTKSETAKIKINDSIILNFSELKTVDEINENNSSIEKYDEEEITAFEIETIKESISKQFIYDFPNLIQLDKVPNYTYSISDFSDEEKQFYEK